MEEEFWRYSMKYPDKVEYSWINYLVWSLSSKRCQAFRHLALCESKGYYTPLKISFLMP